MYEIVSSAHLAQYLAFFRVCSFNSLEGFPRTHRREAADVVLMLEEPGRILVVEGYCNQYIYIDIYLLYIHYTHIHMYCIHTIIYT